MKPILSHEGRDFYNESELKARVKLAGVVFPDAAAARERRLLGQPSTELSTDLAEPERTEAAPGAQSNAETLTADAV